MYKHRLKGEYREIGQQYGQYLTQESLDKPSEDTRTFVENVKPLLRRYVPGLLDEFHGIAEAAELEVERVMAVPVALPNDSLCSAIAVSGSSTRDGRPLFGRNYDFFRSFNDVVELYQTHTADGFANIGCSDHWVGRHDGMNEAGLAVAITWVANTGYQLGVTFPLAVRHILDTYRTVEEAITFLKRIPHARNTNFLIADSTGSIAIIEAGPEKTMVKRPQNGVGVITNHFTTEKMKPFEVKENRPTDSKDRYRILHELASDRADLTKKDLQTVLADPETGVCASSTDTADPIITLWSFTATLGDGFLSLSDGPPNKGAYKRVRLP